MPSHAFSAPEEAKVKRRTGYLIIAVLLTVLDGAVLVYYGWPVWTAWSGDILERGLLVLLAALGSACATPGHLLPRHDP